MKLKYLKWGLMATCATAMSVMVAPPVEADDHNKDKEPISIEAFGHLRARGEFSDNVADLRDHVAGGSSDFNDDSYKYFPFRGLVGVDAKLKSDIRARVSLQNNSVWGEDDPFRNNPGPFGQSSETGGSSDDLSFYELFVDVNDIGSSNHDIRFGRAEHPVGCELHMGDNNFYGGQTFDGARFTLDRGDLDVDFFKYRIDEANVDCTAFCGDDSIDFNGIIATWDKGNGRELQPYFLMYRDGEELGTITGGGGPIFIRGVRTNTLGVRYTQKPQKDNNASHWDYNGEIAFQFGEVDPSGLDWDHSAYIVEGWGGYNFPLANSTGRAHFGIFMGSGDDDPTDSDVDAFFTLFPDEHAYNRLGDMDAIGSRSGNTALSIINTAGQNLGGFSNLNDYNIGFSSRNENRKYGVSVHSIELAEEFSPGADTDIGLEIDLKYSRKFSNNFWGQLGVAYLSPGDALEAVVGPDPDNAMRVWLHAQVDF